MLEAVDGLSIETKFPAMLSLLYINGAVYFTTFCDEESITIDTMLLFQTNIVKRKGMKLNRNKHYSI